MSELGDDCGDPRPSNSLGELMFGAYDDHGIDEIPGATHWPEVLAVEAAAQWEELRVWVEQLQERFSHLDHHVVPRCWWRHNEHVGPCPRCATTSAPASPRPRRRQLPSTGSVRSATSPRYFGPGPGISPAEPPTRTHRPVRARQP